MKKLIYLIVAILVVTACSNEEELTDKIELGNDFVIEDDPNDPVQHERYNIYQEYNVPVYFNDTISQKQVGTDWDGNPVIRYETVDLNWTFDSYVQDVKYKYKYLETPEEQMASLAFVRKYLEICSERMRPYSILLVDILTIKTKSEEKMPQYHPGFRTLVFAQVTGLENDEAIEKMSRDVIKDMVADRVKANTDLCDRFRAISSEHGWYGNTWQDLGNCETLLKWQSHGYMYSINYLFRGDPYTLPEGEPEFAERLFKNKEVATMAEAEAEVAKILLEIGSYGFIRGFKSLGLKTPNEDGEDRNYFIKAMLYLGADKFKVRYGNSPLVMKKYALLYDYITIELGVKL